jgi:hypothetical protein
MANINWKSEGEKCRNRNYTAAQSDSYAKSLNGGNSLTPQEQQDFTDGFIGSGQGGNTNTNTGTSGMGSKTAAYATDLLKTQNIADLGYSNPISSLRADKDTVFQFSTISDTIGKIARESKNLPDFMVQLGLKGTKEMISFLGNELVKIQEQEVELRNQINSQLGLTGDLSRQFRNNIFETLPAATAMGFGFEEVKDYAVQMVEQTGKMTTLGADVLQESQKTARAFYGDLSKLGSAIDAFDKLGIGAKDAIKEIDRAGKSSLALGLNARKVVADVSTNMDKLNTIGFKNGVEGLTRMVQKSIEFNMNIQKVSDMATKLFDPDKAIELSAELQAIGGAIGDFNDPIKLMYMATNDAGGLQDAMIGVAGSLATYNSELGRFEITGANLRKSKALADQMGMSMEEMSKTAVKAAERSSAATALLSSGLQIDEKEKEFLTNISKMEGGKMIIDIPKSLADELGINDTKVALDELSPTIAKGLLENQEAFEQMSVEDIARDQYTATQNMQKDISALLTVAKVQAAAAIRQPLAEFDKYIENLGINKDLKDKTKLESLQKTDEGLFAKMVSESVAPAKAMIAKSMGISESDLESKLKGGESNTPKETTVNHNHTYTIKSDGTVVDAMTREVTKSPSLLNDFSQSIIPDPMEYTSNTLPSKFY